MATAAFLAAALCFWLKAVGEDPHKTFITAVSAVVLLVVIAGVIVLSLVKTSSHRGSADTRRTQRGRIPLLAPLQGSWFSYVALFTSILIIMTLGGRIAALTSTTDSYNREIATLQSEVEKLRNSELLNNRGSNPPPTRPSGSEPIVASARAIFLQADRSGTMATDTRITLSPGEPLQLLLPTTLSEQDKTYYSVEVSRVSPKPMQRLKEWRSVTPAWLDPGSSDPIGVLALVLPPALIGKTDTTLRVTWRAPLFTADAKSVTLDVHVTGEKKSTEH